MRRFIERIKQFITSTKLLRRRYAQLARYSLFLLILGLCALIYTTKYHSSYITKAPFDDVNYVRSAYRVDDSTIRIVFVRSVENRHNLTFEYGSKKGKIRLECHNEHCPDKFSPPCRLTGYIGVVEGLSKTDIQSYLVIFSDFDPVEPLFINVQDARVVGTPKHKLGVCVQPIYLHTDVSSLVQFFEFWLSEKATKFYIYRESYTKEVGEVLEFYGSQNNIEVVYIDWSSLPFSEGKVGEKSNPNRYWFRLEVFMSLFDCIHRARGNVQYLAQTDLDEMIYVGKDRSIISFMEIMDKQEPLMASASFRSQRVQLTNSSLTFTQDPREISFNNLEEVVLEDRVFKRPLYSKMIYKPERVYHVHIHRQLQTEPIPDAKGYYKHVNIAPEGGVVLHIRRLKDMYPWTKSFNSSILLTKSQQMEENYKKRIQDYNFSQNEWNNYGVEVNEKIEECRQKMNKNRQNACHNLWDCDKKVTHVDWVRVRNSWLVV
ncbi:unnamed protein product [Bursaphelenchus okinawaensis]|uniref:Glycosyltransferase family 92 protein n=1 Tax=Bursaphelenchus okinawaensis TaxID=465554 RepID=A0A811KW67_9BILA|nr:unnamed protein product [Bursaphelenchus okinawaensis]CAG9112341.1 unnamed protein product [Bursaphelenchus okinawaensis]